MGRVINMKKVKICIGAVFVLLALTLGLLTFFYVRNRDARGFLQGTRICGIDISGKIPDEVLPEAEKAYKGFTIRVLEEGKTSIEGAAEEFGFVFDPEAAEMELANRLDAQKNNIFLFYAAQIIGEDIVLHNAYKYDSGIFCEFVCSNNMKEPRVPSQDASFQLSEDGSEYIIADATKGNEVDDLVLQEKVRQSILDSINKGDITSVLSVSVPEEAYISVMGSNDKRELVKELPQKNRELKLQNTYGEMNVTYLFGKEKRVLSGNEILGWLSYDASNKVVLDDDKVEQYVSDMASEYDTLWRSRLFKTTDGRSVSVDSAHNAYGYRINQEKECARLKEEIMAASSVEREPVYDGEGAYGNPLYLSRNGQDDLNGTYVEVSIGAQHVWFYKDGKLVTDSDCVTGKISNGHGTIPGAYPLAYKQKSRILRGGSGAGAYETHVNYWMPFNLGQGLHDAVWRGKFGGNIYYNRGSHGCVNLPLKTAKQIFENIEVGTAIVVYN